LLGIMLTLWIQSISEHMISRGQVTIKDLAEELGDLAHKSLYMKLAKETPRGLMETARSFVKDAQNARSKGRLYMWKLQQLKKEAEAKNAKK